MSANETQADVIVIGGGGSGLAAAVSCAQHGLDVLVLEKRPELGGTTGIAVGSFTANRTGHQQRAGIDDFATDHNEDAGKFADPQVEAKGNYPLRGYFLEHAADTLRWLEGMGLAFHGPSPEPPNRKPRMHNVVPNAKAYIATLQANLLRHRGRIVTQATVRELTRQDGRVTGVVAQVGEELRSFTARRAVVLAAGDYANSPQIIGRHKGEAFTAIEGINPHATGDGHLLAETAGAKLVNMDIAYGPELRFIPPPRKPFSQLLPSHGPVARLMGLLLPFVPQYVIAAMIKRLLVTWQHPENALFDDGAILVNLHGERFCDETNWPGREIAVANQPSKIAYILLDEQLIQRYSAWPHFISTAPEIAYAYVADYLRMRPDVAVEADSLEALAQRRDIPVDALRGAAVDRTHPLKRKLVGRRWVLLGPVKAYFTTTEGGAAIDMSFRVLDEQGEPVPGLYAVGQNGLGGQILWGHGLHIAWAMTSGRMLGQCLPSHSPSSTSTS